MRSLYSVPMRPMRQVSPFSVLCECGRCGMRREVDIRKVQDYQPPDCPRCTDGGSEMAFQGRMRRDLERQQQERMRREYLGDFLPIDRPAPPAPAPPAPEPKRTEEQTKTVFLELMAGSGLKKKLTVIERVTHEAELGEVEEYKKKLAAQVQGPVPENATPIPPPRILCPICHDPMCPWST